MADSNHNRKMWLVRILFVGGGTYSIPSTELSTKRGWVGVEDAFMADTHLDLHVIRVHNHHRLVRQEPAV
jgi:hypothetical protein